VSCTSHAYRRVFRGIIPEFDTRVSDVEIVSKDMQHRIPVVVLVLMMKRGMEENDARGGTE
jgi:hypothetical protein